MQYGFVIDNRKCIGCHACTVACKSEHDVPLGVNRTWVKQTEKGVYPHTRRVFSVLRCNHCTDAPCVTICPTAALFTRDDGIVDFDNDRCIGCKSCMQACPYDALYIDPETNTAAKCNYCAHRVDIGLEPACVNVCPEHAIISGNMDDPDSEIAVLLSREQVTVRKPEKGTMPNVYYIDGDLASLNPEATERSADYIWSNQTEGVGHYAKYAEKKAAKADHGQMTGQLEGSAGRSTVTTYEDGQEGEKLSSVESIMRSAKAKRVYDTPDKGVLWGWEVSGYVLTKAISAGVILVLFAAWIAGIDIPGKLQLQGGGIISLLFLGLTGLLLVKDLDQPGRFIFVLLRPQWSSWLVKGGYAITVFGGLVAVTLLANYMHWRMATKILFWATTAAAVMVAIYTAFLFAQAKGRDFWQSPSLALHMLLHSVLAGGSVFAIASAFDGSPDNWLNYLRYLLMGAIGLNLLTMLIELTITHPTSSAKSVVGMILSGRYSRLFWGGSLLIGNLLPMALLASSSAITAAIAGILIIAGIYMTEKIWVEAPQRIALT